jgi:hypothetical protein
MMLAELTLDLGTLSSMLRYIIAILLLGICVITFVLPSILDFFSKSKKKSISINTDFTRKDSGRSSDTPPPAGFAEHLEIIERTAPNADTSVWWEYAKAEMTEAEVAISEAKLARKQIDQK